MRRTDYYGVETEYRCPVCGHEDVAPSPIREGASNRRQWQCPKGHRFPVRKAALTKPRTPHKPFAEQVTAKPRRNGSGVIAGPIYHRGLIFPAGRRNAK